MKASPFQGASGIVQTQLRSLLEEIETQLDGDAVTYVGPIAYGADDKIREAVERLRPRRRKLIFILETNGGFAEVARRISDAVRHHYRFVEFLIPSYAMSAGTVLAMSGNAIWMDYYSVLGPIDPQVASKDSKSLIPALGYLIRYEELLGKANAGQAGAAELELLLNFDQGELYAYAQARELTNALLEEWLAKYKFRDWKKTERRGVAVTGTMRRARAREIAGKLANVQKWNSHGIGITATVLRRQLKLKIDDFGKNRMLRTGVRTYHALLRDYLNSLQQQSVVHTRDTFETIPWRIS